MNKITNGLNAGPPAADGAEVRPSEIGEKLRLAISARSKVWQRIGRKVWRGTASAAGSSASRRPMRSAKKPGGGGLKAVQRAGTGGGAQRQP